MALCGYLLCSFCLPSVLGQDTGTHYEVKGVVLDNKKNKPMQGVNVYMYEVLRDEAGHVYAYNLPRNDLRFLTEKDGNFSFKLLAEKEYTLYCVKDELSSLTGMYSFMPRKNIGSGASISVEVKMVPYDGLILTGRVVDERTTRPIPFAKLSLISEGDGFEQEIIADEAGFYMLPLRGNDSYILQSASKGYFYYQYSPLETFDEGLKQLNRNVPLRKLVVGEVLRLEPFLFRIHSSSLQREAEVVIDGIATMLKVNPGMVLEVAVHSDARGDDGYNLELTQQQADILQESLVKRGASPDQILAKGYGETELLNHCENGVRCNTEMHNQNRRIMIKVQSFPN